MYIYFGWMYYPPYAVYEPLYLVIETDFKFGATGNIDRAEVADSPTAGTTYGIFYDLYYPFDLFISDGQSQISLTMFELAKSNANCSQIATFDLVCIYSGRTTADDYDPAIALPDIRYYQISYMWDNLFNEARQDRRRPGVRERHRRRFFDFKLFRIDRHRPPALVRAADSDDIIVQPKAKRSWHSLRTAENSRFGPELSEFSLLRTVSKVVNNTGGDGQAIFCKLEESGTSVKGKVLAGAGMGLAMLGILPLGGFSTPVAIYGVLLAGVGLYDALNDASAEVERLLFPGQEMTRSTSGGIPIGDNNDLIITYAEIKDKVLYFRVGMKERVACQFVKMTHLVPVLSPGASISQLSDDVLYNLDDGQIVSDDGGTESIYDTLNATTSTNDVLFNFSANKVHATLIHAYIKDADRNHDVISIPSSNIVAVELKKAAISIGDAYRYSIKASLWAESDVYDCLKIDAGYIAYSWPWNSNVFGYKLDDLVEQSATVIATSDTKDRVYIATRGWLPWQRIVSTS
ncbi:hypothetical protein B0H67DRAFT_614114 [Lasiosphaeris hirsuta]|uniref:Uncharacterized protein n=1 Tax=Lasiosphaeris hirsuta TaxID=260670 RepID=A0AA39ZSH5_9PEZI|nr:hypothetical protein B0H67DRAFT_614114 [Lasiosphaeris hirsuta]